VPMKDRRLVPALLAGRDLAATVEAERLEQRGREIGGPGEQLVGGRDRGDDAAQGPGLRRLQAHGPGDGRRIRRKGLPVPPLIDRRRRIVEAAAEVLHVTEDVALAVLRDRLAAIRADAEEGRRGLLHRIALDRQAAQDDEAAAAEQDIVADAGETLAQPR